MRTGIEIAITVVAAVAGFMFEWRRGERDSQRQEELKARVDRAESRLAAIENRHDRMDRAR